MNDETIQKSGSLPLQRNRGLWSVVHRISRSGYLLMLLAAIGFSFKSILVKAIYDNYESDAITIVLMRFYIGAPCFLIALLLIEGFAALRTNPRELALFACTGILGLGGATYFSFLAIAKLGASLATLVVFSYPVIVLAILAAIDRRLPAGQVFAALCAMAGLALVVRLQQGAENPIDLVGVACGLISALCFAAYNVTIEKLASASSPVRQATFSITLLTLSTMFFFGDRDYPGAPEAWALTGVLAICAGFIPFLFFLYGIRRIGAGPGTIANLMGPAFNLVWAYLFFGEVLDLTQLFGVFLIFGGVASLKGTWFTRAIRTLRPLRDQAFARVPRRLHSIFGPTVSESMDPKHGPALNSGAQKETT
ncbi:MAG: DMT family transporter [bacterium]|nr:DMT family transporter [bacterium]